MNRRLFIAALVVLGMHGPARAQTAPESAFAGHWRQVASNAGECTTCTLTVSRLDTTYQVVASNGWTVEVKQLVGLGAALYAGGGYWKRSPPRIDPEGRAAAHFAVIGEELHLTLVLTRPDGSPWRIRAVFKREIPVA